MKHKLSDELHERIKHLCAEGDELAAERHYVEALARFEEALNLLPEPRQQWEAATWIYTALGDTLFLAGDYERARQVLALAMLCPDALDNPFIWLRRGQVYYELDDERLAQDSLASACMLAGPEIFEDENPKYAEFILPKMRDVVTK